MSSVRIRLWCFRWCWARLWFLRRVRHLALKRAVMLTMPGRHVVSLGDEVVKLRLLATVPGAVVAREICDFLATLATAYPNSAID
jgi:hypothetical protein